RARDAVDVKAHDTADVFAQVVAALAAGLAHAAGQRAVHDDAIAEFESCRVRPDRGDLARGLDADDDRQLAPRKGHAAVAPEVEMVERDGLDPDLHLT